MHNKEITPIIIKQTELIKNLNKYLNILLETAFNYLIKLQIIDPIGYAIKKRNKRVEKSLYLHLFSYLKMNSENL